MRHVRRTAGTLVAVVLVSAPLSGCGRYGERLRQRELVVHFDPDATQEQHRAVLRACTGIAHTSPEPIGSGTSKSARFNNVRFRIDNATSRDIARLTECVNGQPGVRGIDIPETM